MARNKEQSKIKALKKARRSVTKNLDLRTRVANTDSVKRDNGKDRRNWKLQQSKLEY